MPRPDADQIVAAPNNLIGILLRILTARNFCDSGKVFPEFPVLIERKKTDRNSRAFFKFEVSAFPRNNPSEFPDFVLRKKSGEIQRAACFRRRA